jgi:hypothetical protein
MQDEHDRSLLRAVQYYYIDGPFELISVGLTLWRYLRDNPRPDEVIDDA